MGIKETLGFYWIAKFSDNSTLAQFDGNGDGILDYAWLVPPKLDKEGIKYKLLK